MSALTEVATTTGAPDADGSVAQTQPTPPVSPVKSVRPVAPMWQDGSVLGALDPIGLAELDAAASLQTRVDCKYVLARHVVAEFVAAAADRLRVLDIDGRRSHGYRSVYFDTPDLASFRAHVQRRRRRFKVRTRSYVESGECVLEVKTKGGRAETVKQRVPYTPEHAALLTPPARAYVAATLPDIDPTALVPSCANRYRRTTLLDVPTRSRVTVDAEVTIRHGARTARLAAPWCIVETKSVSGAGVLDRWFWRQGHRPVTVSKYCVGVAMLYPDAVANPWHRLLERSFVWG